MTHASQSAYEREPENSIYSAIYQFVQWEPVKEKEPTFFFF